MSQNLRLVSARAEREGAVTDEQQRLVVTITLEGPLAASERRPDGQPVALDYLPGARLRGAVAALLLDEGVCPPAHRDGPGHIGPADCPFALLFEGEAPARFGDALL